MAQARLYLPESEERKPELSLAHEAWRLRSAIFADMCKAWNVTPDELANLPESVLLPLYARCAQGRAKQTNVTIEQLRPRLKEFAEDKRQNLI